MKGMWSISPKRWMMLLGTYSRCMSLDVEEHLIAEPPFNTRSWSFDRDGMNASLDTSRLPTHEVDDVPG
jgi:hypothetical protein